MKPLFITLYILFISLLTNSLFGQSTIQLNKFNEADSLSFFEFDKALAILAHLIDELDDSKQGEQILKTKALRIKGHCLEQQNNLENALKISLNVVERCSEQKELQQTKFFTYVTIALIHEKFGDNEKCKSYLDRAETLHETALLKSGKAVLYIRKSSYYRQTEKYDTSRQLALKALEYSLEEGALAQEIDAYMLLAHLSESIDEIVKYYSMAARGFHNNGDFDKSAHMYDNITIQLLKADFVDKALIYSDSALINGKKSNGNLSSMYRTRADIYDHLNNADSALFYYKLHMPLQIKEWDAIKTTEIAAIQSNYELENQEEKIAHQEIVNAKQYQLIRLWLILFILTCLGAILLIISYRKLRIKTKKIATQKEELNQTLAQKEVLLAEVQHRVKNNLQLIIGLLDIQNDKSSYTDIKELTQENQNRIRSIAFLHEKLTPNETNDYVDFESYLHEITELISHSFNGLDKRINFKINCTAKKINLDTAISLGLVLVELINNSMKHAFKGTTQGIISINLQKTTEPNYTYILSYEDNGSGIVEKDKNKSGLGIEIITGLAQQIKGDFHIKSQKGFQAQLKF